MYFFANFAIMQLQTILKANFVLNFCKIFMNNACIVQMLTLTSYRIIALTFNLKSASLGKALEQAKVF